MADAAVLAFPSKSPLVLLVEDDRDQREMYTFALKHAGLRVVEASDGQDGYDLARITDPDVLVTDIVMPRMDGLELCERLRQDGATEHMQIVTVTARVRDRSEVDKLRAAGASSVLIKPCDPTTLVSEVRRLLERSVALRQRSIDLHRRVERTHGKSQRLLEASVRHLIRWQELTAQQATDVERRIRGEFMEMPGLQLTLTQAARLWNLDTLTCAAILKGLVNDNFLTYTRGRYVMRQWR
jgi:CheY-like chemotaxis protein